MNYCCLECSQDLRDQVNQFIECMENAHCIPITLPITATRERVDLLIVDPAIGKHDRLSATVSDWNLPPSTLMVLPAENYENEAHRLMHHPRMGRSIFFCKNTPEAIDKGLQEITTFFNEREALNIDNSISGHFQSNNVSPRWLFHALMEHLDEYIYFKDRESRFLAVSRYMAESSGKAYPSEVLGLTDHDIYDEDHADDALSDEQKIVSGEMKEMHKEEFVTWDGNEMWVASRKLPLHTRSGYLAGTFGLSRDVTSEKRMHQKIEANHERMQQELLLARNLQDTLMRRNLPSFIDKSGQPQIEIATKYLPSFLLSGDYFNVIKTANHGVGVLIADVMGHGVRAAMVTAMLQVATHQFQDQAENPAEFMSSLNSMLHELMAPSGQVFFATAAYAYIEPEQQSLRYVQAGARHGIYRSKAQPTGTNTFGTTPVSPALGLLPEAGFTESECAFKSGDQLIFYTDGILEADKNKEEFGFDRIEKCIQLNADKSLDEQLDLLINDVHAFTKDEHLEDDVCLVALRMP